MYKPKHKTSNELLEDLVSDLELPESAYKASVERYESLAKWLSRPESVCVDFSPHIFAQGSFKLGTANKPIANQEEYDLDLACKLREGITNAEYTQKDLKELVGEELRKYRKANNILAPVKPKQRCWRLEYADKLKFHIDIVPCIPIEDSVRQVILDSLIRSGHLANLSNHIVNMAVNITDNQRHDYDLISQNWNISNPEGYAIWFQEQMKQAHGLIDERAGQYSVSQIDDLPVYLWKSPLQKSIQILKRHRDVMFLDMPDSKPISIIITTLSAMAYSGESNLEETLLNILNNMESLISVSLPRIPNPVRPEEDFADKWDTPEGKELSLEQNFIRWIRQAKADLTNILTASDSRLLSERIERSLMLRLDPVSLKDKVEVSSQSKSPQVTVISGAESSPWSKN